MIERSIDGNVAAALRKRGDELDLVVIILGERRIRMVDRVAGRHDLNCIGRLLKKEGGLAIWIGAHLARMRRVVAADAINAAHRKLLVAARNRNVRVDNFERHADFHGTINSARTRGHTARRQHSGCLQQLSTLVRAHVTSSEERFDLAATRATAQPIPPRMPAGASSPWRQAKHNTSRPGHDR